jgi:hypothetical protein
VKRTYLLAALLLTFVALPLFAVGRSNNIVDDVIRMQKAGVAEDEIIAFVHKGESRFDVTADDMIALHDAGISRSVIKAILDESDARGERRDGDRYGVRGRSTVVVAPSFGYGYYGYPYYYDPFFYDPWYGYYGYGPRIGIGFNFGFGRFYGGHHGGFRHRHR